ncbi:MAG: tripartite tricarboxylate transporter TctB family protein [Halomonas sp.]|nr:tripartite tricarboxylate transporter TctB family protein [Halomonas sp.]MBP5979871.1 tripartite tricarboxylate transporter TctB family protein [Halomonas sp.]
MLRLHRLDLAVSVILFLLGLYVVITGFDYGFLDRGTPDAGFFPVFIGFGISGFATINFYNVLRRVYTESGNISGEAILRVAFSSAALIVFVVLASLIGMLAAGFLLMIAIAIIFGARTPTMILRAAIAAAIMSGVLYLIFFRFLGIVLP